MYINFGGNQFYTNKAEAIKEARRYSTATVYKFDGAVRGPEIVTDRVPKRSIYLLMPLGTGASDENLGVVQEAMSGEIVYQREDGRIA